MHDDILRFDVSVDDSIWVQLLDSRAYLFHETDGFDFGHGFASFHLLVELSAKGHFEDDVDVLFIVK